MKSLSQYVNEARTNDLRRGDSVAVKFSNADHKNDPEYWLKLESLKKTEYWPEQPPTPEEMRTGKYRKRTPAMLLQGKVISIDRKTDTAIVDFDTARIPVLIADLEIAPE